MDRKRRAGGRTLGESLERVPANLQLETSFTAQGETEHFQGGENGEKWSRTFDLGRGAYGSVWQEKCTTGPQHRLRAVKQTPKKQHVAWQRELNALCRFSVHRDHFVQCFGWFQDDLHLYIAMEFIPHGTLQAHINRRPLPEDEVVLVVTQLAQALQYMHSVNFIHRDLKPLNILVTRPGPDWHVKVADFGVSKDMESKMNVTSAEVGTWWYMAPEVLSTRKDKYTPAVDIWSLGAVAFCLLTKSPPFLGVSDIVRFADQGTPFPTRPLEKRRCSHLCVRFIETTMTPVRESRPSIEQVVSHPWLAVDQDDDEDTDSTDDDTFNIPTASNDWADTWDTPATVTPQRASSSRTAKPLPAAIEEADTLTPIASTRTDDRSHDKLDHPTEAQQQAAKTDRNKTVTPLSNLEQHSSNELVKDENDRQDSAIAGHKDSQGTESPRNVMGKSAEEPEIPALDRWSQRRLQKLKSAEEPEIPALDRWSQRRLQRLNAKSQTLSLAEAQAPPPTAPVIGSNPRTDDNGETSGEQTIESRVAHIKARVAELTSNTDSATATAPVIGSNPSTTPVVDNPSDSAVQAILQELLQVGITHEEIREHADYFKSYFQEQRKLTPLQTENPTQSASPPLLLAADSSTQAVSTNEKIVTHGRMGTQPGINEGPLTCPDCPLETFPDAETLQAHFEAWGHNKSDVNKPPKLRGLTLQEMNRRDGSWIPLFVKWSIRQINLHDFKAQHHDYVFPSDMENLQDKFGELRRTKRLSEINRYFSDSGYSIYVVVDLMQWLFRNLSEPVIPFSRYSTFIRAAQLEDETERRDSVHQAINDLPDENFATLRVLMWHLHEVNWILGIKKERAVRPYLEEPILIRPPPLTPIDQKSIALLMKTILHHVPDIFEENDTEMFNGPWDVEQPSSTSHKPPSSGQGKNAKPSLWRRIKDGR